MVSEHAKECDLVFVFPPLSIRVLFTFRSFSGVEFLFREAIINRLAGATSSCKQQHLITQHRE